MGNFIVPATLYYVRSRHIRYVCLQRCFFIKEQSLVHLHRLVKFCCGALRELVLRPVRSICSRAHDLTFERDGRELLSSEVNPVNHCKDNDDTRQSVSQDVTDIVPGYSLPRPSCRHHDAWLTVVARHVCFSYALGPNSDDRANPYPRCTALTPLRVQAKSHPNRHLSIFTEIGLITSETRFYELERGNDLVRRPIP